VDDSIWHGNMGVRGGNVDILLIIFKLQMMQCKWTFTKRFTLATPQNAHVSVTITKKCFVGSNSHVHNLHSALSADFQRRTLLYK